jgi:hypothetical protein
MDWRTAGAEHGAKRTLVDTLAGQKVQREDPLPDLTRKPALASELPFPAGRRRSLPPALVSGLAERL